MSEPQIDQAKEQPLSSTALRAFGFYQETTPPWKRKLPSILDAPRSDAPHSHKQEILAYLRSGVVYSQFFGHTLRDPFVDPPPVLAESTVCMRDDVSVWPETWIYYIERYDLEIDAGLLERMERNHWRIPPFTIEPLPELGSKQAEIPLKAEDLRPYLGIGDLPSPLEEFAELFAQCESLGQVAEACDENFAAILRKLRLDELSCHEEVRVENNLTDALVPPKFVAPGQRATSVEELKSSRNYNTVLLMLRDNKIPLSWNDKGVLWIVRDGEQRRLKIERWKEAYEAP